MFLVAFTSLEFPRRRGREVLAFNLDGSYGRASPGGKALPLLREGGHLLDLSEGLPNPLEDDLGVG
ncbi:hypothetical protein YIM73052_04030 [Thermus antranikianii]